MGSNNHVWHVMSKQVFQFEVLIPDKPIKIQDGHQEIQNARQKFKMAATELKTGQSSPIQMLKLKFETVVLIDCMKDVFKFETPITDKPLKIQNGHQQIETGCHRAKYYNIFY